MFKQLLEVSDDTATVAEENEFASNLSDVIMLLKTHPDLLTLINTIPDSDLINKEIQDLINREIQQKIQEYNRETQMVITPETRLYEQFLRDAFLIHRYGLEQFVSICMGESSSRGWAPDATRDRTDQVKFSQMTSCKKYFQLKATYEELKIKRKKERNKRRISEKTTLLADVWDLDITMPQKYKDFSDSLKSFFTIYKVRTYKNKYTIFELLKQFGEYILKNEDIDEIFRKTLLKLFKIKPSNVSDEVKNKIIDKVGEIKGTEGIGNKTCKQLFCFALDHCIKLNPIPQSGGGQTASRTGPSEEVSLYDIVVPIRPNNRSYWKKILLSTFCIMSFIYFTLLLFETYRLLNATITRILDARVTYLALYGPSRESEADKTFVGYINSFLRVMYESAAGNIIDTLDSLSPLIMQQLINSLMTVATTANNEQYNTCVDGIFGCVNSFFTGESQQRLVEVTQEIAMKEFDTAIIHFRYSLQSRINEAKYIWRSGTRNLVTALHGISFSSILMLHILYPQSYNTQIVMVSASALITAYNTNPLYGIYGLGGQFSLLLYPRIPQIPQNNNVEERNIPQVPYPQTHDNIVPEESSSLMSRAQYHAQQQYMRARQHEMMEYIERQRRNALELAQSRARREANNLDGGRKCRTLKKRKYKTMKKKIIKNKRTIRR